MTGEVSPEGFRAIVDQVTEQGLLIVGSVGRAAIFNDCAGDPMLEFRERGENPLGTNTSPRDIDVIGMAPDWSVFDGSLHRVDRKAFYNYSRRIYADENGNWRISSYTRRISDELDPTLFEPVEGVTIMDAGCITVRPATHHVLLSSIAMRPGDVTAQRLLGENMPKEERRLLKSRSFKHLSRVLAKP